MAEYDDITKGGAIGGHVSPVDEKLDNVVDTHVPVKYRGTQADKRDMMVVGKKQELRRNFKLLTMTGFASMVVCAWEGLNPLYTFVLYDGGPALLFWGFLAVAAGMLLVYLSIAEMASMYDTPRYCKA